MPLDGPQTGNLPHKSSNLVNEQQPSLEQPKTSGLNWQETFLDPAEETPVYHGLEDFNSEILASPEQGTISDDHREDRIPVIYPIGQLHGTYILGQNENGFYMIDQHAAQERIKFEQFRDKLGQAPNELQELLIPLTFDFSRQESLFIEQHKEELDSVGLFFEPFGNQSYIIRSHPVWFPDGFEEEIIREMIEQIMQHEKSILNPSEKMLQP